MRDYQKDFSVKAGNNIKKKSVKGKKSDEIEMFPTKKKVTGVKYSSTKKKDIDYEKEALKLLAIGVAGVLAINGLFQYFKFLGERDKELLNHAGEIIGNYNSSYTATPEIEPSGTPTIEITEGGRTY